MKNGIKKTRRADKSKGERNIRVFPGAFPKDAINRPSASITINFGDELSFTIGDKAPIEVPKGTIYKLELHLPSHLREQVIERAEWTWEPINWHDLVEQRREKIKQEKKDKKRKTQEGGDD